MDKTESYLTQAIVGKRQRVTLGHQVRYQGDTLLSVADSRVGIDGFFTFARVTLGLVAGRAKWITFGLAGALLVAGAGLGYQKLTAKRDPVAVEPVIAEPQSPALPLVPAASGPDTVNAIAVDPKPFPDEPAAVGVGDSNVPTGSDPLQAAGAVKDVRPEPTGPLPLPLRPMPSSTQEQAKTVQPTPEVSVQKDARSSRDKPKEQAPKGLILDDEKETPDKQASTRTGHSSGATGTGNPAQRTTKLVDPLEVGAGVAGSSPQQAARPTIVTIADDNSYVLITNPTTRLPQKYQVGQRLPNGATVQRIDHSKGVVQIDGQTFGLQ